VNGLLVFCPTHDFAMPYLAGPLLKGFIQTMDPTIKITCVDLNLEFLDRRFPTTRNFLRATAGASFNRA
jgi:hypothetical protein